MRSGVRSYARSGGAAVLRKDRYEDFVDAEVKVIWLDQPKSSDVLSLD